MKLSNISLNDNRREKHETYNNNSFMNRKVKFEMGKLNVYKNMPIYSFIAILLYTLLIGVISVTIKENEFLISQLALPVIPVFVIAGLTDYFIIRKKIK